MDWTEIIVNLATKDLEEAEAIAQMAASYGLYIEDYSSLENDVLGSGIDMIEDELLERDKTTAVIHIYINPEENPNEAAAFLTERFNVCKIQHTLCTKIVNEEDWANNWKKYYKPLEIGQRITIKPEWESYDNASGRVVVELSPGVAFGTGTHESTRLCLQALEGFVKEGSGKRILDIGCGSGILAASALLLGAKEALAVDIDPLAVKIAKENAALNNLYEPEFTAVKGDLTDCVNGRYDVVLANIVADVIIKLSRDVLTFMAEGGVFICSGIIDEREADVLEALSAAGLEVVERMAENSWRCFAAIRSL